MSKSTSNTDKIRKTQVYLERLENQLGNPPERRKEQLFEYKQWLYLEIKKARKQLEQLKIG